MKERDSPHTEGVDGSFQPSRAFGELIAADLHRPLDQNVTQQYAYKPSLGPVVAATGAFALCTLFLAYMAIGEGEAPVANQAIVVFSAHRTPGYDWLGVMAGAIMIVVGILGICRALQSSRRIVLSFDRIEFPGSVLSTRRKVIPFNTITGFTLAPFGAPRYFAIESALGHVRLEERFFENEVGFKDCFARLYAAVYALQQQPA